MDNDTEFLTVAEAEMQSLEAWLEAASEDIDCMRSGNVLTIELENGEQVVVNIQTLCMRFGVPLVLEAIIFPCKKAHGKILDLG